MARVPDLLHDRAAYAYTDRTPTLFLVTAAILGSEMSPRHRGALLGLLSLTNQGGTVLGSSLGGIAIGFGSYASLAVLTMCGGFGAAALAVPLARVAGKLNPRQQ